MITEIKERKKIKENIYFMKYVTVNNKKVNRKSVIQDIIDRNRIYENKMNVSEIDKIAYNL